MSEPNTICARKNCGHSRAQHPRVHGHDFSIWHPCDVEECSCGEFQPSVSQPLASEGPETPPAAIRYCLGFLFSPDKSGVVLLRKTHPDWQAGKLNGLGGHVEAGESPLGAMDRESGEELGAAFLGLGWSLFDVMLGEKADGRAWSCHCYRAFDARWDRTPLQNDVGEPVKLVSVAKVMTMGDVIPNLRWLIPKALDEHEEYHGTERAEYERQIISLRADLAAAHSPKKAYYENAVMIDGHPRSIRVDHWTPAEKAINDALQVVESVGADVLLTDAVTLLADAQRKVAEYVDRQIQSKPSASAPSAEDSTPDKS